MHQLAGGGVDWKAIREDFPILRERAHGHPLIYFDSAATSQKPQAVLDALRNYYEHNNANVHRGLHELSSRATEAYETSRQHVAKYIGAATADEIIFTRGTTEGINLVVIFWPSPGTKCVDRLGSECSTDGRSCLMRCRRGTVAAR